MQIDPGPTPAFNASAPASISASAASAVAMLPAITSISKRDLTGRTISITAREWPCAVSTTITSTSSATRASARSRASEPTPTAAPTCSRPRSSFVASGYWIRFWMSLTVIRPLSLPSASTTGSFSILLRWRISSASARVVPAGAVTRLRLVIRAETGWARSSSKRRSRFVRMPTRISFSSTIGTPEMW